MTSLNNTENKNSILNNQEIARYSRQIIVPDIGVKGQSKLKTSSVLIIGVGGLGCPSALYLVGAGVGHIGLVDYDLVEENNLHRQLLHTESNVGKPKVTSAAEALKRLNSGLKVSEFCCALDSSNALDIVKEFDVVIDASDNVATRYLINDACVLSGKPLVSGSALQMEGHLSIFNYKGGPCYRCLFPQPPPPETVNNCSDAGVLGVVPGVIGVLQALEAIKVVLDHSGTLGSRLLLFDGAETQFRNVKLRSKDKDCAVCGTTPSITKLINYVEFCGSSLDDKDKGISLLNEEERISATDLAEKMKSHEKFILLDVRSNSEFEICALPDSLNVPLPETEKYEGFQKIEEQIGKLKTNDEEINLYILCRRGNDSQKAVRILKSKLQDRSVNIQDVKGGLHSWTRTVDNTFPIY